MITVGSLCTGYGGIELGLAQLVPVRLVWCADNEPAAVKLLAHHFPDVPNLGDLSAVDWAAVPHVDAITAGWPCQPWSLAGKQKGARDARAIWPAIALAIRSVRPHFVFLENVASIAGAGELARACGDLAEAGYVGAWDCVRAADVGAPHRRTRLFIAARADPRGEAVPFGLRPGWVQSHGEPGDGPGVGDGASANTDGANGSRRRRQRRDVAGDGRAPVRGGSAKHGGLGGATADPGGARRQRGVVAAEQGSGGRNGGGSADRDAAAECGRRSAADTASERWGEGWPESAGVERGPDAAERGSAAVADADGESVGAQPVAVAGGNGATEPDADGQAALDWAGYTPAITRWESRMGRPAPAPTVLGRRGGLQLNPVFVEWLMGLPAGHVTNVPGLTRNQKLKLLGNGVVPAQAAAAYHSLLAVLELEVAA